MYFNLINRFRASVLSKNLIFIRFNDFLKKFSRIFDAHFKKPFYKILA